MLEYEKKLHFDEHYKKLQSLNISQKIGGFIFGVVGYVAIYTALKYALVFIPDLQPWKSVGPWFTFCGIPFSKLDGVYFIFGLIANCYGSIRLAMITAQNHSVQDDKNRAPAKLLTDGWYAKVRHPMYGTFIILQSSLFLSLRSFIGIVCALGVFAFQYFNAAWEEIRSLIPLFGEEYREYSRRVRGLLLRKWEILVIAAVAIFGFIGLMF